MKKYFVFKNNELVEVEGNNFNLTHNLCARKEGRATIIDDVKTGLFIMRYNNTAMAKAIEQFYDDKIYKGDTIYNRYLAVVHGKNYETLRNRFLKALEERNKK